MLLLTAYCCLLAAAGYPSAGYPSALCIFLLAYVLAYVLTYLSFVFLAFLALSFLPCCLAFMGWDGMGCVMGGCCFFPSFVGCA
ncbi:hypothetical protein BZA05DRAFT_396882 [Tricharina praecox]|uniref:uncharacterized protein n=1 Tax=Tricharina praecox TaxID=43433 RepID=UPI00221ECC7E|nr:uncharacterized protein BZA05DRAFT_396882 [Tricharina praecox]KAI5852120.1 hypothetical protein BZA05DRAFT_396882 [Tricharina praecox]